MGPVELFLLSIAAVFAIGVVGEIVFAKTNVPDVIWLIVVGVLFGPVLGWVPQAPLMEIAPYFGAVTLVVVLFNGGTALNLREVMQSAPRATGLAFLTFLSSMVGIGVVVWFLARAGTLPASWGVGHAATVGAVLGGSSSIVIMPAMQRAKLRTEVANTVNLESAITDVLCVVVTGAVISVVVGGAAGVGSVVGSIAANFGIGIGVGALAGLLWLILQPWFGGAEHEYPMTLAALFVLYVAVDHLGGSAALAILAAAVVMGNAAGISKALGFSREVRIGDALMGFHGRITFMVKSFFFTFIGTMLRPPWHLLAAGVALGAVLVLVRFPAVKLATSGSSLSPTEKRVVTVLLPRGMAAGVLAIMPHYAGVPDTQELPAVVFAAVVTTIVIFAGTFPPLRRRLATEEGPAQGTLDATTPPGAAPEGEPLPPAPEAPPSGPVRDG